jgi:hypothetical protein
MGATVGTILASGSGYYYPPYVYRPSYGYPVYRPYPSTYGASYYTGRGAYGGVQTAYGPYGSASRAAQYNPYTGTAARGASVSTPYGSRSAAQAYNPYTGTYAATHQGSSPTAQWGSSVVSKGNQTAYGQHYSTAAGTAGSVQTSSGGKAVGASTAYGNAAAAKTANGDMYAGKDGNVYKNTGSGWQKYDNGSWNTVKPSAASSAPTGSKAPSSTASRYGGGGAPEGMNQEAQNRRRGADQSQQFQRASGERSFGRRR